MIKVNKQVITTKEIDVQISEITLLSKEEYSFAEEVIRPINGWWWLRSPGYLQNYAAFVNYDGSLFYNYVNNDSGCVRPALRIRNPKSSNLKVEDKLQVAGYVWTIVLETADEFVALCDDSIGTIAFRYDWNADGANDFEKSDVKRYLDEWAEQKGMTF